MLKIIFITLFSLLLLNGCGEKKEQKSSAPGMKCGAGKCGANMFDGNSALAKKKRNILSQMREDDSRKECVKSAKSTKAVYSCVREIGGKKLTMKCGINMYANSKKSLKAEPVMKCGAGKCGNTMSR